MVAEWGRSFTEVRVVSLGWWKISVKSCLELVPGINSLDGIPHIDIV